MDWLVIGVIPVLNIFYIYVQIYKPRTYNILKDLRSQYKLIYMNPGRAPM